MDGLAIPDLKVQCDLLARMGDRIRSQRTTHKNKRNAHGHRRCGSKLEYQRTAILFNLVCVKMMRVVECGGAMCGGFQNE